MMKFKSNLQRLRESRGLSQRELGETLHRKAEETRERTNSGRSAFEFCINFTENSPKNKTRPRKVA